MSFQKPSPFQTRVVVQACVSLAITLVTLTLGMVLVTVRLESHPPTILSLLALGVLTGIGLPLAVLV